MTPTSHKPLNCLAQAMILNLVGGIMETGIPLEQEYSHLIQEAINLGATNCTVIPSRQVLVKEKLAALCNGEYTCPDYGLGTSCPPHVEGPAQFRRWQVKSRYSIVVKIELPSSVMFSQERDDVMRLLHGIVAEVEKKAVATGFKNSKAFAGGSCKNLFCGDRARCCVLTENKTCPHKDLVRPSMSGFGIDVTQLMGSCGWSGHRAKKTDAANELSLSWVAGLILLA